MGEFQHGIMGCFDNCGLCVMAYFCPCIVWGRTAEKVGESCCLCGAALFFPIANLYSLVSIRGKVREAKGIDGSCCNDLLCTLFCGFCMMVQAAQEMDDGSSQAESMSRE